MIPGQKGGNRKPQTFKNCAQCGNRFGPLCYLAQRFCSYPCKVKAQTTGRKTFRRTLNFARAAQRLVSYHIEVGNIVRPNCCENCGRTDVKIEAAHKDYSRPLDVRWLCRSCHVRWDKAEPKNVTVVI